MPNQLTHLRQEINPAWGQAAFIDVETTGLNPNYDEIIEFAITLFAFDRDTGAIMGIIEEYCEFREPGCTISRGAAMVHGITKKQVQGRSLNLTAIEQLIQRAEFLVAHNARFDMGFVQKLFPCANSKNWYCSMNGINWRRKGFTSKGLQNLLRDHQITPDEAHRAGADVRYCLMLLAQINEEGISYLLEMIKGKK